MVVRLLDSAAKWLCVGVSGLMRYKTVKKSLISGLGRGAGCAIQRIIYNFAYSKATWPCEKPPPAGGETVLGAAMAIYKRRKRLLQWVLPLY